MLGQPVASTVQSQIAFYGNIQNNIRVQYLIFAEFLSQKLMEMGCYTKALYYILESKLSRCRAMFPAWGNLFWTAGQRVDPSRETAFIWRELAPAVTSPMTYTNWYKPTHEPNYYKNEESCMHLWGGYSYTWSDWKCTVACCYVCEIDM